MKTETFQSHSATSPPHFRSQYRLGNVVRCYREAVAGLEGVEGCKHLEVYWPAYTVLDFTNNLDSLARIVELQCSGHRRSYQPRLLESFGT